MSLIQVLPHRCHCLKETTVISFEFLDVYIVLKTKCKDCNITFQVAFKYK